MIEITTLQVQALTTEQLEALCIYGEQGWKLFNNYNSQYLGLAHWLGEIYSDIEIIKATIKAYSVESPNYTEFWCTGKT